MGPQHAKGRSWGMRGMAGWVALLASAGPLPAADVSRSAPPPPAAGFQAPAPVTLVWFDVQDQLPKGGFAEMASEVHSIFGEIGVEVGWRAARPGDSYGDGSAREIAAIALAEDPSAARRAIPILGLVVRDQQPTRAFWTFVGNLKRALGIDAHAGYELSPGEATLLARALGRVVAHEVVHAVAPDHPHGAGLMNHSLSRAMLLGPRRPLGDQCAQSVQAALRQPPVPSRTVGLPAELIVATP